MTPQKVLASFGVRRLREVTGDAPWMILTSAILPAYLPTLSGWGSPSFAGGCHAFAALIASIGTMALFAALLKHFTCVDYVPKVLSGAFLGFLAGIGGAAFGFARHASTKDLFYRLAVVGGVSALEGICWTIALDLPMHRARNPEQRIAFCALFLAVQVAAVAAIAYIAFAAVDRFDQGITFFEMSFITGLFVVLRGAIDAVSATRDLGRELARGALLTTAVVVVIYVLSRLEPANVSVYEDDPYPRATFGAMVLLAVMWASLCYWSSALAVQWALLGKSRRDSTQFGSSVPAHVEPPAQGTSLADAEVSNREILIPDEGRQQPTGLAVKPYRALPKQFRVAFSFAGAQRDLVRDVAIHLEDRLERGTVFFDEWFEYYIAGNDADLRLQDIYLRRADLVVVCVSSEYKDRSWTQVEHRAIRALTMSFSGTDREALRVLPLRVGNGDVAGIHINAIVPDVRQRSIEEIAQLIFARLTHTSELRRSEGVQTSVSELPKSQTPNLAPTTPDLGIVVSEEDQFVEDG